MQKLSTMDPIGLLFYYVLCSVDDTAADWYASMIQERDPYAPVWNFLKPIRSSPRWPALAKMMNLPVEAT